MQSQESNRDSEPAPIDAVGNTRTKRPCTPELLEHLALIRQKAIEARKQRAIERKKEQLEASRQRPPPEPEPAQRRKASAVKLPDSVSKDTNSTSDISSDDDDDDDARPVARHWRKHDTALKIKVATLERKYWRLHYRTKYAHPPKPAPAAPAPAPAPTPAPAPSSAPHKSSPGLTSAVAESLRHSLHPSSRTLDFPHPLHRLF
jgi:hypothetical protein